MVDKVDWYSEPSSAFHWMFAPKVAASRVVPCRVYIQDGKMRVAVYSENYSRTKVYDLEEVGLARFSEWTFVQPSSPPSVVDPYAVSSKAYMATWVDGSKSIAIVSRDSCGVPCITCALKGVMGVNGFDSLLGLESFLGSDK